MFKFLIYKFGQFVINRLSIKATYNAAVFMSDLQYYFSPRDRKAVRNNLLQILGPVKNLNRLTREVFRNFGRYLAEFFLMKKLVDEDYIKNNVTIENIEKLDQVLSLKKGAILLTAHIGNWELGGVIVSKLGYEIIAIALPHKQRPVNDLFNEQRQIHGITVTPTHLAIRKCNEALKENKLIALLADRDFSRKGELMTFLGKPTLLPKGAGLFALKNHVPILPCFLVREKDNKFRLTFYDPIMPPDLTDKEVIAQEDLRSIIKKYRSLIEGQIRNHPTQWLMFRQFWVNESDASNEKT